MKFLHCKTSCSIMIALIALVHLAYWLIPHLFYTSDPEAAVNHVQIDERLATAGQPTTAQLHRLKQLGYQVVIHLAPADSYASNTDEASLLSATGITYLNIPVDWWNPQASDFDRFSAFLRQVRTDKVYVHCQANYRASAFVYLYRVIYEHIDADEALRDMEQIWQPNATWQQFITNIQQRGGKSPP